MRKRGLRLALEEMPVNMLSAGVLHDSVGRTCASGRVWEGGPRQREAAQNSIGVEKEPGDVRRQGRGRVRWLS